MITKDIEELAREKLALETDIAQKEADIKIKSGEIKSLQSELDTLAATLKQLENQKGEAQKRLNDLKAQKAEVDEQLASVDQELDEESYKVDKLRAQAAEQAELVKAQESELNSKKEQLEGLRNEEQRLEKQKAESTSKLENLTSNLQETQLNISQAKALITQLQEQTRQMNDAISSCDGAIESGDVSQVPDTALRIAPDFRDSEYNKIGTVNGDSNKHNGFDSDPFGSHNGHSNVSSGFGDDPFKNDPFKSKDAFSSNDPFKAAFPDTNDGFSSDPFGGSFNAKEQEDPFNAFTDSRKNSQVTSEPEKDPFGCDPFAVLHAPTRDGSAPGRPTSPSPALPPKKSKQPPPRPAPPRPTQPPKKTDAFGGSADPFASSGGFADFSNFDDKFPQTKPSKSQGEPAKGLDFTDDPFRDYRYEDPFNIQFDEEPPAAKVLSDEDLFKNDKFDPSSIEGRQSVPLPATDPFVSASGRASAPIKSSLTIEDEQLAWVVRESLELEEDRKKRLLQEQADLELAISLSKAESKKP